MTIVCFFYTLADTFEDPQPPASQKGLKGKNTRLKHQSEQFWVAEKPTKGGGALERPVPRCSFLRSQNCSNCCLSLVFVGFNPFDSLLACRGERRSIFLEVDP